jgi:hypothetical protein
VIGFAEASLLQIWRLFAPTAMITWVGRDRLCLPLMWLTARRLSG